MRRSPGLMTIPLTATLSISLLISACDPGTERNLRTGSDSAREALPEWHQVTVGDQIWEVGRLEGPEHEVLGRIHDVIFVGDGLAISDGLSNRVHWYDRSGQHEMSVGRSGDGPGEFRGLHDLGLLPDGTLVALDRDGSIDFFGSNGDSRRTIRFPGWPLEMCLLDSTLVILGIREGGELPLHLMPLADDGWTSVGPTVVAALEGPNRGVLVQGLLAGKISCMAGMIVYARASDGTVRAMDRQGSILWEIEMPSFVARVTEDAGDMGIRHGPPLGATEVHGFTGLTRFGKTLAVQVWRRCLETGEISFSTVFVNLADGRILGKDDTLPLIWAASEDRIAIGHEADWPAVRVHSISHR